MQSHICYFSHISIKLDDQELFKSSKKQLIHNDTFVMTYEIFLKSLYRFIISTPIKNCVYSHYNNYKDDRDSQQ